MTDQPDEPLDDDLSDLDDELDNMDISAQIALFVDSVEDAKAALLVAHQLAMRITAAFKADVLKRTEALRFADTVIEGICGLQAMLVKHWSGSRTDREILEFLHLIHFPKRDYGVSLDDVMLDVRRRSFPKNQTFINTASMHTVYQDYWRRLKKYLDEHPDEPLGWQDIVKGEKEKRKTDIRGSGGQ